MKPADLACPGMTTALQSARTSAIFQRAPTRWPSTNQTFVIGDWMRAPTSIGALLASILIVCFQLRFLAPLVPDAAEYLRSRLIFIGVPAEIAANATGLLFFAAAIVPMFLPFLITQRRMSDIVCLLAILIDIACIVVAVRTVVR
jgi:hypothetical protein